MSSHYLNGKADGIAGSDTELTFTAVNAARLLRAWKTDQQRHGFVAHEPDEGSIDIKRQPVGSGLCCFTRGELLRSFNTDRRDKLGPVSDEGIDALLRSALPHEVYDGIEHNHPTQFVFKVQGLQDMAATHKQVQAARRASGISK